MLASLTDKPFDSKDWVFEVKHDGYRALALLKEREVSLYSRNLNEFNSRFPDLVRELEKLPFNALLDGEIAILDKDGISRFQLMQNYLRNKKGTLVFYVFDILNYEGHSLSDVTLVERKKFLESILPSSKLIKYSPHFNEGLKLFKEAEKLGLEGLIAKKSDSHYLAGKRTKGWLKVKTSLEHEVIIGGFTAPSGGRKGFGSLLTGVMEGKKIMYRGKVGTGFNDQSLKDIHKMLLKLKTEKNPFQGVPARDSKNVTWVRPELVAQVRYTELTDENIMRHPAFLGLREDKKPEQVKEETPIQSPESKKGTINKKESGKKIAGVPVTNTSKIFWPEHGITKGDVIKYYEDISEFILPHLKDRPQSLYRTPDGILKKGFFQKNMKGKAPDWIPTVKIHSESTSEYIEFMLCQKKEHLIYMANLGCIEINPWSSRTDTLDQPDYAVFDLDPLHIGFDKVIEVALEIRKMLDEIEVTSYCKTSGSDGFHIYVPLGAKYSYEQSMQFVKLIETYVHARLPSITSLERMPSKRKKRVYLDYLQNGKGKTMSSVYSLRPRKNPNVSTPVKWEEVNKKLNPDSFNINSIRNRLEKVGDIWKDMWLQEFDMGFALNKLTEKTSTKKKK